MAEKQTALAVASAQDWAIASSDSDMVVLQEQAAELGGIDPRSLSKLVVPSGTSPGMWSIETAEGLKYSETVTGVIVALKTPRAYWKSKTVTGGPPDCRSDDGKVGIGEPGGDCTKCRFAAWGSAIGEDGAARRGQACKSQYILYLQRPEDMFPVVVQVPPSSIKPIKNWLGRLVLSRVDRRRALVTIGLLNTTSGDGQKYWEVTGKFERMLTPDESRELGPQLDAMGALMQVTTYDSAAEDEPSQGGDVQSDDDLPLR